MMALPPDWPSQLPRRLLLTLRLGEMPEHVPAWRACQRHGVPFGEHLDGGPIDRLLSHFGGGMRLARVHSARTPREQAPQRAGARRFDDIEQLSGVARVLRIELQQGDRLPELMTALAQLPTVEHARPERLVDMGLDGSAVHPAPLPAALPQAAIVDMQEAWAARDLIRLPEALAYAPGDPTVIMGLADTGVVMDHPALHRALRPGFDTVDLQASSGGPELVGDDAGADADPQDEVGHGTGCAGIVCADSPDLPPGAAGRCQVLPARVLGAALKGQRRVGIGSVANIDAGMKRLIDLGVKVINMSFGTASSQLGPDEPPPHSEVVRYALARGVILVAASGNSGLTEPFYPAALPGVIAVGAVDLQGKPARFSTRGDHVALSAPGQGIWTCGLNGWQRANGTSFAAPFVSAVCALMAARAEARACPIDPEMTRQLLMQSSRPHAQAGESGMGRGVLDALAALRALDDWLDRNDGLQADD
ncbi:S8 family peptidase [Roseateles sp. DB2]|uniref:S8 family peptidase n=1 Tax=Roseateles sp. DB2 TaxID=3453717 RepID=UPI003EEBA8B7